MTRKKKQRDVQGDPLKTWKEIQDHQYDPGYWTGGRVHPLYHASRRSRYGWLLFGGGILSVALALRFLVAGGETIGAGFLPLISGVVGIAAGIRMIAPKKSRSK